MEDKEKIKIYEEFLHKLQLNAAVVMNGERVQRLIRNACDWSYSHRVGNGQYTDAEQQDIIDKATRRLTETNE